MPKRLRIGSGAGFSGDRLEPAVLLAERGDIDFLALECLGERTVALAQLRKRSNPATGYDPLLQRRVESLPPTLKRKGIRLISNFGAANPLVVNFINTNTYYVATHDWLWHVKVHGGAPCQDAVHFASCCRATRRAS